jgi:pyridoxal phosphate enzyme (YggS family)
MIKRNLEKIIADIPESVQIVVVTKNRSIDDIKTVYDSGYHHLGENRVQELLNKYEQLPKDIQWHLIGHLQSNKVKYIVPFIYLIHSVDSYDLALEIDKQAKKHQRVIPILIQFHVAQEESKFGISVSEMETLFQQILPLENIDIRGIMGMATNTEDASIVKEEFKTLQTIFIRLKETFFKHKDTFNTLSMGMSSDYKIAIDEGSNMIRLGSIIFENS